MASNVIVALDDLNKLTVKTTPAMSLKSILDTACDKFKLNSDSYALKYRKDRLDLSLSCRFANLPPGAKLELIRVNSGSASALNAANAQMISVALQLDEGGRVIGEYSADTSIWQILQQVEDRSNGTLNLTQRTGPAKLTGGGKKSSFSLKRLVKSFEDLIHAGGSGSEVYYMPVCVFMNKEFNDIEELQNATLKSLGASGKVLIRVIFKETDVTLGQVKHLLNKSSASPQQKQQPKPSVKPSAAKEEKKPEPVAVASSIPKTVLVKETPNTDSQSNTVETQESQEKWDRNVKVYKASSSTSEQSLSSKIDLPDNFFELSGAEMKYLMHMNQQRRKQEEDRPLMTKAMRDKLEEEKIKKYPKTMIRIKFPDMTILQGQFLTEEKTKCIYDFVKLYLDQSVINRPFYLYKTPPMQKLNSSDILEKNMFENQLAPASLLYFGLDGTQQQKLEKYLSDSAMAMADDLPVHPSLEKWLPSKDAMEIDQAVSEKSDNEDHEVNQPPPASSLPFAETSKYQGENSKPKVPKWLKLHK